MKEPLRKDIHALAHNQAGICEMYSICDGPKERENMCDTFVIDQYNHILIHTIYMYEDDDDNATAPYEMM